MQLHIKKLHQDAKLPSFAHVTDAGMDLFCSEGFSIAPGERVSAATGIAVTVPAGCVGLIWDKSGMSQKRGLKTLGGVVDAGYIGEVFVGLVNIGSEAQTFSAGDKIAQLIIQKIEHPDIIEITELEQTTRGEGRFGSTGR